MDSQKNLDWYFNNTTLVFKNCTIPNKTKTFKVKASGPAFPQYDSDIMVSGDTENLKYTFLMNSKDLTNSGKDLRIKYKPWLTTGAASTMESNCHICMDFGFVYDGKEYLCPNVWIALEGSANNYAGGVWAITSNIDDFTVLGKLVVNETYDNHAPIYLVGYESYYGLKDLKPVFFKVKLSASDTANRITTYTITRVDTGVATDGTAGFTREFQYKIARAMDNLYDVVSVPLREATGEAWGNFDPRRLFKDDYYKNYGTKRFSLRMDESSFAKILSITNAEATKMALVSDEKEYVSSADMVNDSSQPVTIKTADYAHKITQTHTFVKETTTETSQQIALKSTLNIPFEILNGKMEITGTFSWKQTEKLADTFTVSDEKTYTLTGQQVNLAPKSKLHIDTIFSRGTVIGKIEGLIEIEKLQVWVKPFPTTWVYNQNNDTKAFLVDVDIDQLIKLLDMKTIIKKDYVDSDGVKFSKYYIKEVYDVTGDIGTNMQYKISD